MSKAPYLKENSELVENLTWGIYLKLEDKATPTKYIAEQVNKQLVAKGLRTVSKSYIDPIMKRIHDKERNGNIQLPEDQPWSIGACKKYEIPFDKIPFLIQIQDLASDNHKITIREAKWFVNLYPAVQALAKQTSENIALIFAEFAIYQYIEMESNDVKALTDFYSQIQSADPKAKQNALSIFVLYIIGSQYAHLERISDLTESGYPNTSELDNLYFIKSDISAEALIDGSRIAFSTPEQKQKREQFKANFQGYSKEKLEQNFGKLTPEEVNYANDFLRAYSNGYVTGWDWVKSHPQEWAILCKKNEAKKK
jgi:hypothetical protein